MADSFEQLGYQQESPSVRNSFLAGAQELRNGIPPGEAPNTAGPDMVKAMSTDLWLDFLAIRLNEELVEGKSFVINLNTPDNNERFVIELSNGVLTSIADKNSVDPDLTITINRTDLEKIMMRLSDLRKWLNRVMQP